MRGWFLQSSTTFYGKPGATVENLTIRFGPTRIWRYNGFGRDAPIEGTDNATILLNLRGGWYVTVSQFRTFVRFNPDAYAGYTVQTTGTMEPFVPPGKLSGTWGTTAGVSTPVFRKFSGFVELQERAVPIFPEAAEGHETRLTLSTHLRPTKSIRVEASNTYSRVTRARDNSEFARTIIPRIKVEYQPKRSLFFRTIAEYRSQRQSELVEPHAGLPLFADGSRRIADFAGLRLDWLFSYEPTPGTAVFLGYGTSLEDDHAFRGADLKRTSDGFFVKLAYQFRR